MEVVGPDVEEKDEQLLLTDLTVDFSVRIKAETYKAFTISESPTWEASAMPRK